MKLPFAFLGGGNGAVNQTLALPTFQPPGGIHPGVGNFSVTVTVHSPAIKFRYTINDANIDLTHGTLVNDISSVVTVPDQSTLRAIAIDGNNRVSHVKAAYYERGSGGNGGGNPPGFGAAGILPPDPGN